ncbi:hypothetical protein ACHAXA_002756 [Cyclostephanos tholiformis]|uniref:HotDog ACOT-type domain-containing protein n=1 Tax=Cyclostephanos tholiformis TaxID=382380 RepID=A0ABD3RFR9_9STRA
MWPRHLLAVRRLSGSPSPPSPSLSSVLRVPSDVARGIPDDVRHILPLLHDLSDGARRGIPRWVPTEDRAPSSHAPRKRSASWLEITYPFSTDVGLRTLYMLADGTSMRAGRFLEELDAFAADVSVRHARAGGEDGRPPLAVVTAAHDGLSIFSSLSAVHDLRLRGAVVSVGETSMEVRTDVLRVNDDNYCGGRGGETLLGSCHTIMVARDAGTFEKVAVPPLCGGDVESAELEAEADLRRARRWILRERNLRINPPMPDEVPILHELWREAHEAHLSGTLAELVPMNASRIRNLEVMQPKNRNVNGYIFGGYLMRRSLEAAWLSAFKHCKHPMVFVGADDVTFARPVEVGKIIEVSSRVAFVDPEGLTIRVFVDVNHISLESGRQEPTCEFHFVFHTPPGSPRTPQVQPVTYAQTLLWLESRRRWLASKSEARHVDGR